jgi:hypothetical protein
MRAVVWSIVAATLVAGSAVAQPKVPTPAVLPVPETTPPVEFGIGHPTNVETFPTVRPPMPVTGAPIEIPPGPMFWLDGDYLLWRTKGGLVPPVVVGIYSSANPPLPVDPRMSFPVSDDHINGSLQSGYRLRAGMWTDKPQGTGYEAIYTSFLHNESTNTFFGGWNSILARPFVDVVQRSTAVLQLSNTIGTLQGVAAMRTQFDSDGFELNMLRRGPAMIGEQMHWVLGVRYWGLEESLAIEGASQGGNLRVASFDSFATQNRFLGPQFGGQWLWERGRMSIDVSLKMAVGAMRQETSIDGGSTAMLASGAAIQRQGGLLALSSNIGDYDRTKLAWIRDTSFNLRYRITDNVQFRLGYEFFWASSVLRPGQQIDLGVNPTLLPFNNASLSGPIRPWYRPDGEIFWMHGINVGLSVQF